MGQLLRAPREFDDRCDHLARGATLGFFASGFEHDDLVQEARIGVLEALRDWRPGRGSSFDAFAFMCARRKVITRVRLQNGLKHRLMAERLSIEQPSYDAEDTSDGLAGVLFRPGDDPLEVVLAREEVRELFGRIAALTPVERECVERCLIGGEEYGAIAGYSVQARKRVDNALLRARRKLAA